MGKEEFVYDTLGRLYVELRSASEQFETLNRTLAEARSQKESAERERDKAIKERDEALALLTGQRARAEA